MSTVALESIYMDPVGAIQDSLALQKKRLGAGSANRSIKIEHHVSTGIHYVLLVITAMQIV